MDDLQPLRDYPAKRGTGKTREMVRSLPAGRKIIILVPRMGFWHGYLKPMIQNLRPDIQIGDVHAMYPSHAASIASFLAGSSYRGSDVFFDHDWSTKATKPQVDEILWTVQRLPA